MRGALVGARQGVVVTAVAVATFCLPACSGEDGDPDSVDIERVGKSVELGDAKTGALVASSQRNDGTYVVVDEVVLPSGGYVAIYADGAGAPGRMLAVSKLLDAGTSENVRVELASALASSSIVHAMLHAEDNKNDKFDFPKQDAPIVANGAVVEAALKVQVN